MIANRFAKFTTSAMAFFLIAAGPADRDWSSVLRSDAQALHDLIEQNHPGAVNAADPEFMDRNDEALRTALDRAENIDGYPGYVWAMRAYIAAFDDGHVLIRSTDAAPDLPVRWPGFLTGYDDHGRQIVRTVAVDAPIARGLN